MRDKILIPKQASVPAAMCHQKEMHRTLRGRISSVPLPRWSCLHTNPIASSHVPTSILSPSLPPITICLLNPSSSLGLEILTQLLAPSKPSLSSGTPEDTASKHLFLSSPQQYHIKAVVEPIYSARDLDDLIEIQNQFSSSPLHRLDIFEVNSLIPNSYTKIIQYCDYVREDTPLPSLLISASFRSSFLSTYYLLMKINHQKIGLRSH
jgi:hypothetical protein